MVKVLYEAMTDRGVTCAVMVEDGVVVEAGPVLKVFVGQPLENLKRWLAQVDWTLMEVARVR